MQISIAYESSRVSVKVQSHELNCTVLRFDVQRRMNAIPLKRALQNF